MTTQEYIRQEMLKYDFNNGTVKAFAIKVGCSEKYAHNKIREWNIPYKQRVKAYRPRDKYGHFTFKNNDTKMTEKPKKESQIKNRQIKSIPLPIIESNHENNNIIKNKEYYKKVADNAINSIQNVKKM